MRQPKVQIVIPVYNAERYLRRCLDSLQKQTYSNWQAILVDDASIDGSAEIIKEYMALDGRFTYLSQKENSGASAARNAALTQLSGEYTAFLDADDYWESTMLETLVAKAEHHDCDVVQCRFIYDFPGGKQVLPIGAFQTDVLLRGAELKRVYRRMMTGINMNHVCMKLIRTPLLKDLRFDTTLKTAEDLKFCIGLFQKVETYCFTDRVLYHYCRNETSLTGKGLGFWEKLKANRRVSGDLAAALEVWKMDTPFYRLLSYMRPYTIVFSKVFRMVREKLTVLGSLKV